MSGSFSRRDVLRVGGAALGGAALTAAARGPVFAQQKARIRFGGYVESQEQLRQTVATLEAYMKRNPGVEINPEFTDFGSFTDKIATEAAGGNAPDMFSVNVDLLGEYSRRGVIRPLNQFVPNPLNLSDYVPGAVKAATIKGQLFAIPNDCVGPAVVIKNASFEKAGIKIPDQMWTWEQLERTATDLSKALGPRFWGAEDGGGNYIPCDIFMRGRGKELFTPERQMGFTPQDLADWFAYWDRLRKARAIPPGDVQALATGDDLSRTGLISGRAAMLFQLTDAYVGLQALTKDELSLHMAPNGFEGGTLKQQHYTYAGNSTAVWSKTPHVDRIVDIIRYMHFEPEGVALFYRNSGLVPASKAGRDALAREGTDSDRRVLAYIDLLQNAETPPRNPGIPGMSGMLRRMNEGVAFGRLKPQEAADQFVAEAQKRLKV